MAKKQNKTIWILVGVIVALVIILGIYISITKTNISIENPLKENDFKILSASWNQDNSWNAICENSPSDSKNIMYSLATQQNYDLNCKFSINGDGKDDVWIFEEGDNILNEGLHNIPIFQDNLITICCSSDKREGEVCDSITLPAKCS